MTQNEAVLAYLSAKDLNQQKLSSGKLAKKVFELKQKLQSAWDFQVQEEAKIYEAHPAITPGVSEVQLNGDPEKRQELIREVNMINSDLKKLGELEVDIDFEPFDFNLDFENVSLSGEDIGRLSKFVNFI